MVKLRTTVYLEEPLLVKAKEQGYNISEVCNSALERLTRAVDVEKDIKDLETRLNDLKKLRSLNAPSRNEAIKQGLRRWILFKGWLRDHAAQKVWARNIKKEFPNLARFSTPGVIEILEKRRMLLSRGVSGMQSPINLDEITDPALTTLMEVHYDEVEREAVSTDEEYEASRRVSKDPRRGER